MRYQAIILSLLLLISGCVNNNRSESADAAGYKSLVVDDEVYPYVSMFAKHLRDSGSKVVIDNVEIYITPNFQDDSLYGYCSLPPSAASEHTPIIYLNENKWRNPEFSVAEKEQLLFHELGHCVLGLDHDVTLDRNRPTSIMYPIHTKVSPYYQTSYSEYITKLFNYPSGKTFSFNAERYDPNYPKNEVYYLTEE